MGRMPFGVFLTILGGSMNGSFAVPMRRMRGWAWEHQWFTWAWSGLIVVPVAAGLITIPDLWGVWAATSTGTLALVALFGFLWGISGLLFGIGIERLGLALGYGIIIGISSALGAIGPLIAKHPEQLLTPTGIQTVVGVLVVVAGVVGCTVAGRIREGAREGSGSLAAGLMICLASGIGAPMMNFGLVYGSEIADNALRAGAGENNLVNAIWPVELAAGFVANAGYCGYLMFRGSGWRPLVAVSPGRNNSLGFLMGFLWMGGLVLYGYGSRLFGPLGLVFGWPIMMGTTVLAANVWGVVTGEWSGAPRAAKLWVGAGTTLLIGGVLIISLATGG